MARLVISGKQNSAGPFLNEVEEMKKTITALLAITSLIGVCLAGSDAGTIKTQLLISVSGMCLFGVSMFAVAVINRGDA